MQTEPIPQPTPTPIPPPIPPQPEQPDDDDNGDDAKGRMTRRRRSSLMTKRAYSLHVGWLERRHCWPGHQYTVDEPSRWRQGRQDSTGHQVVPTRLPRGPSGAHY